MDSFRRVLCDQQQQCYLKWKKDPQWASVHSSFKVSIFSANESYVIDLKELIFFFSLRRKWGGEVKVTARQWSCNLQNFHFRPDLWHCREYLLMHVFVLLLASSGQSLERIARSKGHTCWKHWYAVPRPLSDCVGIKLRWFAWQNCIALCYNIGKRSACGQPYLS